jgi:hypothetical protein
MSFKRYQVVCVTVLRGQLHTESFRVRDALANDPMLLDIVFSTEEAAREFADKLNAAESISIDRAQGASQPSP